MYILVTYDVNYKQRGGRHRRLRCVLSIVCIMTRVQNAQSFECVVNGSAIYSLKGRVRILLIGL